nr:ribonuclease P protein component [Candidatus Gracilibacteria bacterium]
MISKNYRLKESEVKKVLQTGKPFFSFGVVLNYKKNTLGNNRFAIVIGGKSVNGSVERNFFRRIFYDICKNYLEGNSDLVFVVKKQTKLDKNLLESIKEFEKDINFLMKNTLKFNNK